MKNYNDLILRTMTQLIAFILLGFSVYLFFAGHNSPGGGFIGGLMTAAAFILMYITYGFVICQSIANQFSCSADNRFVGCDVIRHWSFCFR